MQENLGGHREWGGMAGRWLGPTWQRALDDQRWLWAEMGREPRAVGGSVLGLELLLQPHRPPNGPLDTLVRTATGPLHLPFSLPGIFFPRSWHSLDQRSPQIGGPPVAFLEQPYPFCHCSFSHFILWSYPFPLPRIHETPCLFV